MAIFIGGEGSIVINSGNTPTFIEGDSGSITRSIPVTLTATADLPGTPTTTYPVFVDYTINDDTATRADSDYQAPSRGRLTFSIPDAFNSGDTFTQSIDISIIGDTKSEPDENFSINLTSISEGFPGILSLLAGVILPGPPTLANITLTETANGTIANDDAASAIQFGAANFSTPEGNGGGFVDSNAVVVTRSDGNGEASVRVIVDRSNRGTATGGNSPSGETDYDNSILVFPILVNFVAGETNKRIVIPINADTRVEPNETIGLRLDSSSVSGATIGSQSTATLTINNDDGTTPLGPGITVTPTSGLVTTEAGGAATFTVALNSAPTADVTIGISSSNPAEGTVSTSQLVFTPTNFNTPQTITVTGVDDQNVDGDIAYNIITAPAVSTDSTYNGLNTEDVSVINNDNDGTGGGITVVPTSGLATTEAGGTATFTVALTSAPTSDVSIGIASSNPAEGIVSTSQLVFTPANFNIPQAVTITGVDDTIVDGSVFYNIITALAVSIDPNYSGQNASDVSVVNNDNDSLIGGVLTFQGVSNNANDAVTNFYSADRGVTFSRNSVVLVDTDAGGDGLFGGEPNNDNAILAYAFPIPEGDPRGGEDSIILNSAQGFGSLEFSYTSPNYRQKLEIWSDVNGTGQLLYSTDLPQTELSGAPDPDGRFSSFAPTGLIDFAGAARSVVFGSHSRELGIDNILLGA